ncbi:MAG TPA: nitrile hydratase subunit alpha, partial [Usitatibacter sp.]|nr:nitrile hydratase subunit alpha [Usitatibacter sp.]
DTLAKHGIGRPLPAAMDMLLCDSLSKLLVITAESQAFNVSLNDLPTPEDGPALLGNPNNIAAILDQSVFEAYRFLTVLTEKGYVDTKALDAIVEAYETKIGPRNGAAVVAKAWTDSATGTEPALNT